METCNPHAYLCHICVKQLDSVPALEEKLASAQKELESLKKELNSKVSNLRTKQFVYGSKRPSMPPHSKDEAPSNTPRTTSQGSSTSTESHSPSEMPLPTVQSVLLSSTVKSLSGGQYPQAISPIPYAPSQTFDPICSVTGSDLPSSEMELNPNTQQSSTPTTQRSPKVDVSASITHDHASTWWRCNKFYTLLNCICRYISITQPGQKCIVLILPYGNRS